MKVLFADDHIPDDSIPTSGIEEQVRARRPDLSQADVRAHRPLRHTVEKLRDDGFEVVVATTHAEALRLARSGDFDVAIVDLGWMLDPAVAPGDQGAAGWRVGEALKDGDAKRASPTAQIIYSHRLPDDRSIADQAAQRGMLPVYKSFDASGTDALRAAVKYLQARMAHERGAPEQAHAARAAALADQHRAVRAQITGFDDTVLRHWQTWTWLTIGGVGLSFVLVLVGIALALTGNAPVGVVTAAASILTGLVSNLLYTQLKDARDKALESRAKLEREAERLDAAERLELTPTSG